MNTPKLPFQKLHPSAKVPTRANATDAGLDLTALKSTLIPAGFRILVGTGLAVALPAGLVGSIRPRSGLATNHGVTVLNSPGTIDSGYRGEIKVLLYNSSITDYLVGAGDRIAQLVCEYVALPTPLEVDELPPSPDRRGAGGFGSTGK